MKKLILCVDDDPDDAELLEEAIHTVDSTARFIRATNGREALTMLSSLQPDLIFLDINMPVMSGRLTLEAIRKNAELDQTPVYILSTTADTDEMEVLRKIGADQCLTKPNSLHDLCDAIKFLLQPNR